MRQAKKAAAIQALLTADSVAEAARQIGVGRATLNRWLGSDDFRRQYREVRQQLYDRGLGRLVGLMDEAVSTLAAAMRGEEVNDKPITKQMFLAARSVVEHCHNISAGDMEARLAEVEAEITKILETTR